MSSSLHRSDSHTVASVPRRRLRARLSLFFAAAVAAAAAVVVGPATPAHAALAMQCNFHEINVTFDPPLTSSGQTFSNAVVASSLSGCVPIDPVFEDTVTGNFENGRVSGTVTTCVGVPTFSNTDGTGKWVFSNSASQMTVQGVFPFTADTGEFPNGEFMGGPLDGYTGVHRPVVSPIFNGTCATGVTSLKTQGTADFSSP